MNQEELYSTVERNLEEAFEDRLKILSELNPDAGHFIDVTSELLTLDNALSLVKSEYAQYLYDQSKESVSGTDTVRRLLGE